MTDHGTDHLASYVIRLEALNTHYGTQYTQVGGKLRKCPQMTDKNGKRKVEYSFIN